MRETQGYKTHGKTFHIEAIHDSQGSTDLFL